METQDLVTLVPWTFIAQICNLFIQMYLVKRFLFKPVNEILAKRQKMATEELEKARAAEAEAQAIRSEYESNIAGAKEQANEILANASRTAAAKSDEIIAQAQAEATALKSKAEADIQQERKKAINEIKNEIGGLAMDIAGKVIEREVSEEDHKKLIDEFIENVGETA